MDGLVNGAAAPRAPNPLLAAHLLLLPLLSSLNKLLLRLFRGLRDGPAGRRSHIDPRVRRVALSTHPPSPLLAPYITHEGRQGEAPRDAVHTPAMPFQHTAVGSPVLCQVPVLLTQGVLQRFHLGLQLLHPHLQ